MSLHTEINFEIEICEQLTANGWLYSESSADYDRKLALFPADVLEWVQTAPFLQKMMRHSLITTTLRYYVSRDATQAVAHIDAAFLRSMPAEVTSKTEIEASR